MTDDDTDTKTVKSKSDGPPERYKVRLSHPNERKRVVFSTVSLQRARSHIERRYPRGSEAYLEHPDGTFESYEHERQGDYGTDTDRWAPFDPEAYRPPEEVSPPGESAWADKEG